MDRRKIICYAHGDRCHGCLHYYGKADECECKPNGHQIAEENRELEEKVQSLDSENIALSALITDLIGGQITVDEAKREMKSRGKQWD